jgi:hypothetical protein
MSGFWKSQRQRIRTWGLLRTLLYYILAIAPDKLGIRIYSVFEYLGHETCPPSIDGVVYSLLHSMEDWTSRDLSLLREYPIMSLVGKYRVFFDGGDRCAVARCDGTELACVCWIHLTDDYSFAPGTPVALIQNCFTFPEHRGKCLYSSTLRFVRCSMPSIASSPKRVFIDCLTANFASTRGIRKAGFTRVGWKLKVRRWTWHWRLRQGI